MAQKRMFDKSIVTSARFLTLPTDARCLYYDLGMFADDDGYCEALMVMRMTNSNEQNLKVLEANGLIRLFDNLVAHITDWETNNFIRKDRYCKSRYVELYPVESSTKCLPLVNPPSTQIRLGKDRLDKVSNINTPSKKSSLQVSNQEELKTACRDILKGKPEGFDDDLWLESVDAAALKAIATFLEGEIWDRIKLHTYATKVYKNKAKNANA